MSQRWIFAFMCFLAVFNAFSMRGCLPIGITEMVRKPVTTQFNGFSTESDICFYDDGVSVMQNLTMRSEKVHKVLYDWDEYTQGIILSSFFLGYIFSQLPGGLTAEKYGGKHILGLGIFSTSVFTLLVPLAVQWGDSPLLVGLQVLMGFGEGVTLPAINVLLAHWAPPEERSLIGSFVFAGGTIGLIFSTVTSGLILAYFDWQTIFYCIGCLGVIWYIFWILFCYDRPEDNPFITDKELAFLKERLFEHTHAQKAPVPWSKIFRSGPLWASILGLIGFNWSSMTLTTEFPKYASVVLKLPVEINGYLTSCVHLSMWIGTLVSSWMSDYAIVKYEISRTKVRKVGSIVSLTCGSILIVVAAHAGCNRATVILIFAAAMAVLGAGIPSILVNTLDLSPNYAGTIMALANGIGAVGGVIAPYLVGILTTEQTTAQWKTVFWVLLGVTMFTNLVFLVFGSGEVQSWNDPDKKNRTGKSVES